MDNTFLAVEPGQHLSDRVGKVLTLHLKNDTNELIYKTETDPQTQKTNLQLPKGKVGGRDNLGVWD